MSAAAVNRLARGGAAVGGGVGGDVTSPCINVCRMDDARGVCTGCLRTLDEIAGWSRASDEAKRAILAEIAQRRGATAPGTMPAATADSACAKPRAETPKE